jgi:hypothetical protein
MDLWILRPENEDMNIEMENPMENPMNIHQYPEGIWTIHMEYPSISGFPPSISTAVVVSLLEKSAIPLKKDSREKQVTAAGDG